MNRLVLILVFILLSSCSQKKMFSLMAKTPEISYEKPSDHHLLNDYQKDAIYLIEIIKQSYPRINTKISEVEFTDKSTELVQELGSVNSQFEFETHLKKYMALLKDGHSNVISFDISLVSDQNYFNWYLLKEKEDWIIRVLDESLDSTLVGLKVVSVNDIPIDEIEERVNAFEEGENEYHRLATFSTRVMHPKYWKALGVINNEEKLSFSVKRNGKVEKYSLEASPEFKYYQAKKTKTKYSFTSQQNNGYSYKVNQEEDFAYLQMNTCLDYVSLKSEMKNYTNVFIRPFAKAFLKNDTKDARNFGEVLQSMFTEIHSKDINNLIIDLRYNGGGDERTGKQLIWYLTERTDITGFTDYLQVSEYFKKTAKVDYARYDDLYQEKYDESIPKGELNLTQEFYQEPYFEDIVKADSPYLLDHSLPKFKGKVYVIVGPDTFSAAQFLATTIADNGLAKIVGTPVGNKPTTQTGASVLKLPNTKAILSLSYFYAERPDKSKNQEVALFPDLEVYQTYSDLLQGIDSEFDAILKEIKEQ